jgi:serine/threonine protein kinase
VFVRYGAFTPHFIPDDGVDVPAIRDLNTGALVPDVRGTGFHVPPWVHIPDFLQAEIDAMGITAPDGFPQVRGALHLSNAGGVYDANLDGRPVILKEARPHVGWTPDGRGAVARLHDEAAVLQALQGRAAVPSVVTVLTSHGHAYLAMERIEAIPLSSAVATRHPLVSSNHPAHVRVGYRDWVNDVAASLRKAVTGLHEAGWVHGDLHPANVLVRDDNTVVLIDLEMSRQIDDQSSAVIGAPGFVAMDGRSPREQDLYALACIELFILVPLIPLLSLSAGKASELVDEAAAQFELDRTWADDHIAILSRRDTPAPEAVTAPAVPDTRNPVIRTLLADATPERGDRLWPGDPAQFREPATSLAHGALGALAVLDQAGVHPTTEHLAWVEAADERSRPSIRFGLLDGVAGAAWAYRIMGLDDAADRQLERCPAPTTTGSTSTCTADCPGLV